jgi:HPr kinase/phosphorylase
MAVSLKRIINSISKKAKIKICCREELLEKTQVSSMGVNLLGLELIGHLEGFNAGQIQVIDEKGHKFISGLDEDVCRKNLSVIFSNKVPGVILTNGQQPKECFLKLAEEFGIPVLKTELSRWNFTQEIEGKLDELLAPRMNCRGTMMEVFGLGVLISGKSNVGKSECAIDLLQRGHRLIGDDVVDVSKRANRVLVARGKFPISHRMELRGIGIIDVVDLYGISAIKEVEKIELIVELERWATDKSYERLGIEEKTKEIMGISIPFVEIPVAPGRNTAILIEVAAMNYRLRRRGIVPAKELERDVIESCRKKEDDSDKK